MKVAYVLLFALFLGNAFDSKAQSREEQAGNYVMSELARVHKEVFSLPYSYDHIKGVFMPEIEANRLVIAPHYPTRNDVSNDQELIKQSFQAWCMNYPLEVTDYIENVEQFVIDHQ